MTRLNGFAFIFPVVGNLDTIYKTYQANKVWTQLEFNLDSDDDDEVKDICRNSIYASKFKSLGWHGATTSSLHFQQRLLTVCHSQFYVGKRQFR